MFSLFRTKNQPKDLLNDVVYLRLQCTRECCWEPLTITHRFNHETRSSLTLAKGQPTDLKVNLGRKTILGHEMSYRMFLTQEAPECDDLAQDLLMSRFG